MYTLPIKSLGQREEEEEEAINTFTQQGHIELFKM